MDAKPKHLPACGDPLCPCCMAWRGTPLTDERRPNPLRSNGPLKLERPLFSGAVPDEGRRDLLLVFAFIAGLAFACGAGVALLVYFTGK